VFLEFVIDPACSVVFEAEANEENSMSRPPRDPREPLFSAGMLLGALLTGAVVLVAVAGAYWWAVRGGYADEEVRAVGFSGIVLANLFMIYAMRSSVRSRASSRVPNRALAWVIVSTVAALTVVLYVAPVAEIFRIAPLGIVPLFAALGVGAVALGISEAFKFLPVRRH
jgi:Ca2+-transporting ATPase